ncbi:AcrR family transcriptional regulator [Saccharothrix tamanrassetensis]|uniref:AcrR family transcriptional regulator n=1 Tax=Saccharothrix tamanrassetensis TaxID=1051531 RepID=A0A841CIR0_9PSEU|nr:TetR/AcrR family transcriptional regulator [Saccharothrix tamanrassetensis]MBB5958382.1 AcrR family transcriptional regulator [Saccharothrix tamanrassetensis]
MTAADEFEPPELTWRDVTPAAARRMLIAAAAAFAGRGYHATTTRDIAARAGMSPAAVYIHYRSKEELLFQISRIGHAISLEVLTSVDGPDPVARLAAAVSAFASWHAEHHTTARVVQYELSALTPPHLAEVVELRRQIEAAVRGMIEDGVAAGVFDVPDVRGATLAVLSLCIDVARWYRPGGRRTPAEIGSLYADLVLRMLGN